MPLTIIAGCLIVASVLIVIQSILIGYYKKRTLKAEVRYIDTSGVNSNPPKFIDLMKNKTINFVCDGEKIVISQINVVNGLNAIERIAQLFKALHNEMQMEIKTGLEESRHSIIKWKIFKQIINQIYLLSKPHAKNKRKLRSALYSKCTNDFQWTLLLVEQILDYWGYVGELLALLGRGGTLRQIHGGQLTWNCITWDINGKKRINPRYALSRN